MLAERFAGMAAGLDSGPVIETPVGLVRLLVTQPRLDLCTKTGSFLAYKKKGKWVEAAKREGLAKTEGERLNIAADAHYAAGCQARTEERREGKECVSTGRSRGAPVYTKK